MELRSLTPLLQVYDMPTSVRFYRDVLGFGIHSHSPHRGGDPDRFHWVWLRHGTFDLMLNTAFEFDEERSSPPDPARCLFHHDTMLYLDCPEFDATFAELSRSLPAILPPTLTSYGMRQLSIEDPDGFQLRLTSSASQA